MSANEESESRRVERRSSHSRFGRPEQYEARPSTPILEYLGPSCHHISHQALDYEKPRDARESAVVHNTYGTFSLDADNHNPGIYIQLKTDPRFGP